MGIFLLRENAAKPIRDQLFTPGSQITTGHSPLFRLFTNRSVLHRPIAPIPPDSLLEIQNLSPFADLLNQISRWFADTCKFEEFCFRALFLKFWQIPQILTNPTMNVG